ncbi:MAG: copper oxidase (laccase) domain-containing protein, partial [Candidatus Azotimanducaceae bacterium]
MSAGVYGAFNLALHVGDQPAHVTRNRQLLQ